jgi:enamine deaminase RidA (YjgF/YER057c/UK114 family)
MDRKSFTPDSLSHYCDGWHMSPGIASNGLLFLTGMTGNRGDDTFASDPDEQIRDAFAKITDVLNEAGLDYSKVVEMTSYHVGISDHIDVFRMIRDEHVVEPYPAWTAIEVSGFITDGAIVEIRVVADASSIA